MANSGLRMCPLLERFYYTNGRVCLEVEDPQQQSTRDQVDDDQKDRYTVPAGEPGERRKHAFAVRLNGRACEEAGELGPQESETDPYRLAGSLCRAFSQMAIRAGMPGARSASMAPSA